MVVVGVAHCDNTEIEAGLETQTLSARASSRTTQLAQDSFSGNISNSHLHSDRKSQLK